MVARFVETLRHLRPSQVYWRLRYLLERRCNLAYGSSGVRWDWPEVAPPAVRSDLPRLPRVQPLEASGVSVARGLSEGAFELLNRRVEIDREAPDWRLGEQTRDRLWTVTLHYHGWIEALADAACGGVDGAGEMAAEAGALLRHYVTDWIHTCGIERPGSAALAWNSYATATRLGSWVRAYLHSRSQVFEPWPGFEADFLCSLWQQAAYLHDHLEWDLRGNHLMRDAVGLAWAGRLFEGEAPRVWLRKAAHLAAEQVDEQVLPDGGHFERSPKYHVDVMQDLLALALLLEDRAVRAKLRRTWARMADYLAWMRHPDGDIPLLNDGALVGTGTASTWLGLGEWIGVTAEAARGGRHFADSGLVVWHGDPWSLFFDVGPVGPDHQPGHAHADTLSIECSFAGRRLFVDPGTHSYDDDERRRYDRGTGAHNTVTIDGADSSEMWRIFRVGRRARPVGVEVEMRPDGVTAGAAHDGYDYLPGRPRHSREVVIEEAGALTLRDAVAGSGAHLVEGGFLVEPSWSVEPTATGWLLSDGHHRVAVEVESGRAIERFVERRPYHPRYGVELEATRIGWRWQGDLPLEIRTETAAAGGS